ncbi:hypothetical protein JQX08_17940 [Pseudomonas sp. UL073]|uniref:Lipoprotein n=1 Tax=Zestomonas insulae TaxID=2809017 RepID=A0ABS2IHR0_9GAMM|nr:hypothetical protein [Pseudomonas insulae]MBM7062599.1 hypothetical protein [Pseudomonas insulae]
MPSFTSRYLAIAAVSLLLAACQSAPQHSTAIPPDPMVVALSQLELTLNNGQLDDARRQLADVQARASNDTRVEYYQRRLADAYLQKGQAALQQGDLDSATQALGQARSLMPQAPALTTGLDSAIGQARSAEQQAAAARAQAAAQAKADADAAARLAQAQQLRAAAEQQAAALKASQAAAAATPSTPAAPRAQLIDPAAKTSVVALPMLDSQDNDALRALLDRVAADVVQYDCAVRIQVRQAKDYPWVASLLSARVKRLQPGYALRVAQDLKAEQAPRLLLSPR